MNIRASRVVLMLPLVLGALSSGCGPAKVDPSLVGQWREEMGGQKGNIFLQIKEDGSMESFAGSSESENEVSVNQRTLGRVRGNKMEFDDSALSKQEKEVFQNGAIAEIHAVSPDRIECVLNLRGYKRSAVGKARGGEVASLPDERKQFFVRIASEEYARAAGALSTSVPSAPSEEREEVEAGTILTQARLYRLADAEITRLRSARRGQPESSVVIERTNEDFPPSLELAPAGAEYFGSQWRSVVDLFASGRVHAPSTRTVLHSLWWDLPFDQTPVGTEPLRTRGNSYSLCSYWGISNSSSNIFVSEKATTGPDSSRVHHSADWSEVTVEFKCRVARQWRNYRLRYVAE